MATASRRREFAGLPVAVVLAACTAVRGAQGPDVRLRIENSSSFQREGEAVTSGVPFARGAVKDVSRLSAAVGGRQVPAQFTLTVPWDDGSVRWALFDTQATLGAGEKLNVRVTAGGAGPMPSTPLRVDLDGARVRVATGPMEFTIDRGTSRVFESIKVDGREMVSASGRGLVLYRTDGGETAASPPEAVTVEHAGPMRATVCLRGRFPSLHNGLLGYTLRLTAYAGQRYIKAHIWFENDGGYTERAPGGARWFAFDGLALELGLAMGDRIQAACEGVQATGALRVAQYAGPNHDWASFNYKVTSGSTTLKTGDRTDGVVSLSGARGNLVVAVRHFWEQYEKAIELDERTLHVWLWPRDGEWPRTGVKRGFDAGEYPQFRKADTYHLSGGVRKGHEVILDFTGRGADAAHATLAEPLMAAAEPAYYALTEAAAGWFAPAGFHSGHPSYDGHAERWDRFALQAVASREDRGSLNFARQGGADARGFWFGWMDFGDLLWARGPCSLHYDWTWIMMLNYLRTGRRDFLRMGTTMARHRIDVDQIWAGDSSAYTGLSRYESGYTSVHGGLNRGYYGAIPSHNWIGGVILYYMLTGETVARECALNAYEGLKHRLIDRQRANPDPGIQTRELGWTILNLCSLYDMTADRRYLDDALALFHGPLTLQWKELGPYLQKGLQYFYSTQGLCELHQRTGDDRVLALLREGCEDRYPADAHPEWMIFVSNIYAYVGHHERNETYLARARELFSEYPGQQLADYPCYRPGSGAWTKESAKILRNGHILQFVHWKRHHAGR